MSARSVVTIGSFDGVHLAHAALVRRAREIAAQTPGTRTVALAFDPHPSTLLSPERTPPRLTTFEQRADLLGRAGADEVVRLEPTPEFLAQSPEAFIARLVHELHPLAIVECPDFRFGKGRAGNTSALEHLGRHHNFQVETVETLEVALTDCTVVRVSSTMIRWLLENGRVRDAAILLGRDYEIEGAVVRGDRRGRTIGFPTANINSPCMVPADGVYAGIATLPDARRFPAAISVGSKPTFGPNERAVEAFLIDADQSGTSIRGLPEYDWTIRVTFSHWLRDQARFESIPALIEQMHRDCARALDLLQLRKPPA
jgi:riboflavin kinase/FMN adenylyltransferase